MLLGSITTNLLNFSEYSLKALDTGVQVDVIYTDFAKAFDKVNHLTLLSKLNYYGLSNPLVKFFSSYLHNRIQYVSYCGFSSSEFRALSGVPQGSNLGPLLFTLFINNISECIINCNYLLYADDLKLFRTINNVSDCLKIQEDVDRLVSWSNDHLKFHVDKCFVMNFTKKSDANKIVYNYLMMGKTISAKST